MSEVAWSDVAPGHSWHSSDFKRSTRGRAVGTVPPSLRQPPALACGKWLGGAYRDDDVVDCLAGYGRIGFVGDERIVGGVRVTMETVGRQRGHVVLLGLPLIVVDSLICGEDHQRLTVEAGEGRRLLHRRVRHSIL